MIFISIRTGGQLKKWGGGGGDSPGPPAIRALSRSNILCSVLWNNCPVDVCDNGLQRERRPGS